MAASRLLVLSAIVGAMVPSTAVAEEDINSGNSMLRTCQEDRGALQGICLGRMDGLSSGLSISRNLADFSVFCPPAGATTQQKIDVFVAYLKQYPERRHLHWSVLATDAFNKAWPCPKGWQVQFQPESGDFVVMPPGK